MGQIFEPRHTVARANHFIELLKEQFDIESDVDIVYCELYLDINRTSHFYYRDVVGNEDRLYIRKQSDVGDLWNLLKNGLNIPDRCKSLTLILESDSFVEILCNYFPSVNTSTHAED